MTMVWPTHPRVGTVKAESEVLTPAAMSSDLRIVRVSAGVPHRTKIRSGNVPKLSRKARRMESALPSPVTSHTYPSSGRKGENTWRALVVWQSEAWLAAKSLSNAGSMRRESPFIPRMVEEETTKAYKPLSTAWTARTKRAVVSGISTPLRTSLNGTAAPRAKLETSMVSEKRTTKESVAPEALHDWLSLASRKTGLA